MRFEVITEIAAPRDEVWRQFDDPERMKVWQPTLQSFEPLSGTPGQPGAVSRLTYQEDGRTIVLTETILERRQPEFFSGTYDSGMAINKVANRLEAVDATRTRWVMDAEFEFRGLLGKIMGFFFKGMIRKRLRADCDRFKAMVEARA